MEKTSTRDFFKLSKTNLPLGCFIVLQLPADDFRVRKMGGKQQHYKRLKQIRYFNIIDIAECLWEIGCTS